ncbi:hypothetical protein GCM10010172_38560 [Paractinoplanes ferrugineus]|uniref:Uncharacterized protein n=1 Tax=Paractinoplanes ferrugineus TaxID=113564 RepID=A0A919MLW6_9ACTN|nr:hypothetical protein [Actinoplanes ferrugineus]GIE12632.1 hypothetical protein Afe05nite_44720 [Actinoplanes ferrugineus]
MPAGTTLARLVDEFVTTMRQRGMMIDRRTVEEEMSERIAEIAERLDVDTETVLREHARVGWGAEMAAAVIAQVRDESLLGATVKPGR